MKTKVQTPVFPNANSKHGTLKSHLAHLNDGYFGSWMSLQELLEVPQIYGQVDINLRKVASIVKSIKRGFKLVEPVIVYTPNVASKDPTPEEVEKMQIVSGRHRIKALAELANFCGLPYDLVPVPVCLQSYGIGASLLLTNTGRRFANGEKLALEYVANVPPKSTAAAYWSQAYIMYQSYNDSGLNVTRDTALKIYKAGIAAGYTPVDIANVARALDLSQFPNRARSVNQICAMLLIELKTYTEETDDE